MTAQKGIHHDARDHVQNVTESMLVGHERQNVVIVYQNGSTLPRKAVRDDRASLGLSAVGGPSARRSLGSRSPTMFQLRARRMSARYVHWLPVAAHV